MRFLQRVSEYQLVDFALKTWQHQRSNGNVLCRSGTALVEKAVGWAVIPAANVAQKIPLVIDGVDGFGCVILDVTESVNGFRLSFRKNLTAVVQGQICKLIDTEVGRQTMLNLDDLIKIVQNYHNDMEREARSGSASEQAEVSEADEGSPAAEDANAPQASESDGKESFLPLWLRLLPIQALIALLKVTRHIVLSCAGITMADVKAMKGRIEQQMRDEMRRDYEARRNSGPVVNNPIAQARFWSRVSNFINGVESVEDKPSSALTNLRIWIHRWITDSTHCRHDLKLKIDIADLCRQAFGVTVQKLRNRHWVIATCEAEIHIERIPLQAADPRLPNPQTSPHNQAHAPPPQQQADQGQSYEDSGNETVSEFQPEPEPDNDLAAAMMNGAHNGGTLPPITVEEEENIENEITDLRQTLSHAIPHTQNVENQNDANVSPSCSLNISGASNQDDHSDLSTSDDEQPSYGSPAEHADNQFLYAEQPSHPVEQAGNHEEEPSVSSPVKPVDNKFMYETSDMGSQL